MYRVVAIAVCACVCAAFPYYRDNFPNGYSVPDPCGDGIWNAVGHYSPTQHTIDKNPFGLAFRAANHTWTRALCMADSDGDGMTNGVELGDPTCVWTKGATPTGQATGHPGICNPVGACRGSAYSCGCMGHACVG